jgi:hypothetical protein
MNLKFFVNADDIANEMKAFKEEAKQAIEESVKQLSAMTHAKVVELAQEKLKSTRKIYTDNLDYQELVPGLWVVSLDQPALWIEEGRKSGDMTQDLLKTGAHIAKDGSRYKAIPFDHGKPPSQMDPFSRNLVAKIKSELKKANIPFKKLELNADGSPRIGRLHTMNISSPHPSSRASHPALSGLTIYQTKGANGKVRRDIMTFRMVSDKHKGSKWIHPGRDAEGFFEKALQWAEDQWEREILPQIMARFDK